MLGQLYADDVQAYQHCLASEALVTLNAMNRTMGALGSWMSSNRLRLNLLKMQFIWLGTRQQLAKLDVVALTPAFPHFTFSSTVRDFGVTLDQELTLAPHIPLLCRACYSLSSVNFVQFPGHLPILPQPPLSICLSPPGLTTVVLFILVSLPLT